MSVPLDSSVENVQALKGLIGWFNQSSAELIQEFRRLEQRADYLKDQLEAKHRELEKSLREREEARAYLVSVLESLKAGVLVLDRHLRPTFMNSRVTELAGSVDDERVGQLLGEQLSDALRRGDKEFLPLEFEKAIQGPQGITAVHFMLSEVGAGKKKIEYVLVFQDLSTLKRLEAENARSRRLASLGIMASEVAHQVRSPLGGIELYASLLKEKASGDPKRLAAEILTAVQSLYTTISRLLSFATEPSIVADVLPVAALMADLEADCRPVLNDSRWALTFGCEPGLPPLWADRGLLSQALLNLVVNAKEAMPDGGRIAVAARLSPLSAIKTQSAGAVEIKVTDEGIGIAPENRERIFDPFFTTKTNGTGLGLALTHKIVSAHRGTIEIASGHSRGTEISLFIPTAEELNACKNALS
jgi:signal transduction histidine kinase